ncbi:MAG TPA: CHAD domain-containing protein [Pyrinomonadaceae bacterium]|nr:CHAD domain-containing protein [Pyrinomonadaceae bacterium]
MAKAKEITGIDCAADALLWATEVLRVRLGEAIDARDAALDFSDIEGVHQMRVAIRRLRSALRDFLPLLKKRPLQKTRKNLKRIADRLGAVRDQDVAILALEQLQSNGEIDRVDSPVKEGIELMLAERRLQRETVQAKLIKALDADDLAKLKADFAVALEKAARKKKSDRIISFNEAGRAAVASGLNELYDLGASLYEPFKTEDLHEMRIAAKRLRYAVELFTACWGASIEPFAEEIAKMQGFLGEVHDCDIWIESMGGRLRRGQENAAANGNDYQTAAWLLSEFVRKRTKEYRSALKLWSEWVANRFAERMRATIQSV